MNSPQTGPTDAILLPDRQTVAVTIHHTPHLALFRPLDRTTRLVPIGGDGARGAVVHEGNLWFSGYNTLHRLDLGTMELKSSGVLQPGGVDPEIGVPMQYFTGTPQYSQSLSSWLVPRPYSGDLLVVSDSTLTPKSVIRTGGRPHDVVEFNDGLLLILDHPFDVVRLAHVANAVELS